MGEQLDILWQLLDAEANNTNCKKRQVGCIIYDVLNKEVMGIGHNYHPDGICDCVPGPSTAVHAEINAIDNIRINGFNKDECIALVNRKPCDNCNKALEKIVYEVRYRQE